ncbi:MAG: hypothetical protein QOG10_5389, partial [Kribbellaceae bacterium]|nr:hypothetical protein [Kribbellaceae bacterium]
HLRRIRAKAAAGAATCGPIHSAKQEITESVKKDGPRPFRVWFLLWLHETYQRTAETCTQQDVDEWLASGPTTRSAIRTFFVVAKKSRLNTAVTIQHRSAKTSPSLSQDQRLAWIHELLTGTSESLPYRVAGMLLLLYAQPLVKVQMSEIGRALAGVGTNTKLRAAERPARDYGGLPSGWAKMGSSSYRGSDGFQFETHWYQNMVTRGRYEFETKVLP